MIQNSNTVRSFETESLRLAFSTEGGLVLYSLFHKKSGREWLREPCELFELEILKQRYPGSSFAVTGVESLRDETVEGLSIDLDAGVWGITARVVVLSDRFADCAVFLQLGAAWPEQQPQNVYLSLPFMKRFGVDGSRWRLSGNPCARADGSSVMALHQNYPMPACNLSADDADGFALRPYELNIGFGGLNLTGRWFGAPVEPAFTKPRLFLPIDNHPITNVIAFKLSAVTGGWCEAYERWREDMRSALDLSGYERDDLNWMHTSMFPGFVFSYSKQFFDYKTKTFDIDRVIDQGQKFGGYDFLMLWHQYPRLGIDRQGQWDFNDNVPGGTEGLRKLVARAHERGVKIVFPYNPWDDTEFGEDEVVDRMVDMVEKTDCDGLFFDTMETVPLSLRQRLDAVRPGVAFFSEAPPRDLTMAAHIMAQWDQSPDFLDMPQSYVLRYLLPEMNALTTGRWRVGEGKDMLIDRAVFNGTGFFLWEEVFGRWLPFSDEQAARIRRWREILDANRALFRGMHPIPFYPTEQPALCCNRFRSDDGKKTAFCLYNGGDRPLEGALLDARDSGELRSELWHDARLAVDGGRVSGRIDAGELLVVLFEKD